MYKTNMQFIKTIFDIAMEVDPVALTNLINHRVLYDINAEDDTEVYTNPSYKTYGVLGVVNGMFMGLAKLVAVVDSDTGLINEFLIDEECVGGSRSPVEDHDVVSKLNMLLKSDPKSVSQLIEYVALCNDDLANDVRVATCSGPQGLCLVSILNTILGYPKFRTLLCYGRDSERTGVIDRIEIVDWSK